MFCADSVPATVGALSSAIAKGLSNDELALLAAVFTQLGDSLSLILASRICAASGAKDDNGGE